MLREAIARAEKAHVCRSGWIVFFPPLEEGTLWIAPLPMGARASSEWERGCDGMEIAAIRVRRRIEHACFAVVITEVVLCVVEVDLDPDLECLQTRVVVGGGGGDDGVRWMPAPFAHP